MAGTRQNSVFIGLVRAINLAGHNAVGMSDLREMLNGLGFQDVQSLLQSGNVVFRANGGKVAALEQSLETAFKKRFGFETDFFIRTLEDIRTIIAANPFPKKAEEDPSRLLVLFLKSAPDAEQAASLGRAIKDREIVHVKDRYVYIVYPDGIGRSRLTSAVIEKNLGVRGTGRNWNTVLKLEAIATEKTT